MAITLKDEVNLVIENIRRYTRELEEVLRRKPPLELPPDEKSTSLNIPDEKMLQKMQEDMVEKIKRKVGAHASRRSRISFKQALKKSEPSKEENEAGIDRNDAT